jgi:phosphohistidine swiveling domain-containing protein
MVANILSEGAGRETLTQTHAYELSWVHDLTLPTLDANEPVLRDWADLNTLTRDVFFYELNKLKIQLQSSKESFNFYEWSEYLAGGSSQESNQADKRQQHDARYAIFDFSNVNESNHLGAEFQSIGGKKRASGKLFIIENPASFHQQIPKGSIVLAPYFDNRWVHHIKFLEGIITHKGSQLSHSAIVARESDVPFCIVTEDAVKDLQQGDTITLDSIQLRIMK